MWVLNWNRNAEIIEAREENNYSGAAIGQTGSSTRQELAAWILVLSQPMRSKYPTDSASMLAKAKKLIEAAKAKEELEAQGRKTPIRKPYRKPWGLQKDGLWQHAWKAVPKRGAASEDLIKVKGHATNEEVEAGISTAADTTGNNKSDANADEGVEKIKGEGLIVLGKWIAERHDQY